jgi:hypothetical protein
MDSIIRDIILYICDFLDNASKLYLMSAKNRFHLMKKEISSDEPLSVDSDLWYAKSFHYFSAEQGIMNAPLIFITPLNCTKILIIRNYSPVYNSKINYIIFRANILLQYPNRFLNLKFKVYPRYIF